MSGRPSIYTEELGNLICEKLIDGQSLRKICSAKSMPNRSTVLRWLAGDADFAAKYAHAREMQADAIFDEMQDVADRGNPRDVNRAKLRVSTMQWRAQKLAPKKYGDKLDLNHSGGVTIVAQDLDEQL